MLKKITVSATSILALITSVIAHSGHNETAYNAGMMGSEGWMHNGAHMMGSNIWGMGWFGALIGLTFWILAILGIIYLYQRITENGGEE